MDTTANLLLPYIAPSQAQKHVTHNEALRLLDALVQLSVSSRTLAQPPATASEGDRYLVASGATGAWGGWDGDIAVHTDGGWMRLRPRAGWRMWVEDEELLTIWTGSEWTSLTGSGEAEQAARFGVNTEADVINRLAVKSDAVLLSHDDVTPGSGDVQFKINKAATSNDTAIIFQTGWTAHGLFGLLGDDALHFKVSPDGVTFHDALVIDQTTGRIGINEPSAGSSTLNVRGKALSGSGQGIYALTLTSSNNDNANKGGAFSNAAYRNTNNPFLIFASLAQQSSNRIYWGGGGWGLPSVTDQRFFSGSYQPGANDTATLAFHVDTAQNRTHRDLVPGVDNAFSLGSPSLRFSVVHAATGTISTSDGRLKEDVVPLALGLDFLRDLEPVSYRWKTGGYDLSHDMRDDPEEKVPGGKTAVDIPHSRPGTRTHYGLIAQQVKETLDAHGIEDFAGWTLADKDDPASEQGLRYEQFVPLLIKAIQELAGKVDSLTKSPA